MKAAQMAVGIREEIQRKPLNLTQLRKNKRKRPDKTSGRKQPRVDDVDVIPAGDVDDEELDNLRAAVGDVEPRSPTPPPASTAPSSPPPPTASAAGTSNAGDNCAECGLVDPPKNINRSKRVLWIECDKCKYWYHRCCVDSALLPRGKSEFICVRCCA